MKRTNFFYVEKKWAFILLCIALVFLVVFFAVKGKRGDFTWTAKELSIYDKFANELAKNGFESNAMDLTSFSSMNLMKTDEIGKYKLLIGTSKGDVEYFIYRGGKVSSPKVVRNDIISWVCMAVIVLLTCFEIGYLIDLGIAEYKRRRSRKTVYS